MATAHAHGSGPQRGAFGLGLALALCLVAGATLGGCGLYRSDDYIICQLKSDTTSEALAERFLQDPRRSWVIEEANPGAVFQKGKTVIIPLQDDNRAGLFREGFQVVPILCYHRFAAACRSALCVSESAFRAQLAYLKENGYRTIRLEDLYAFLSYRRAIPLRSVVITIDDGYRSSYDTAFPLLKEYGFTATLFIYTDFVEATPLSISWDQLREMKAAGFEVASHSVSHCDLTMRQAGESETAYEARIMGELTASKAILDRELQQDTRFLAYPFSKYDRWVLGQVEAAGYDLGLTLERGAIPFFADPLVLKRITVQEEGLHDFGRRISTLTPVLLE